MPKYIYEVLDEKGNVQERFELVQRMSDPPLTVHPETGQPVRRVFLPPWIAGKTAPMRAERALADDRQLERMGFTKYVKTDRGYEKTAGSGPELKPRS